MPIPIPISIPEGPKSDYITKEVQDLLLDDAIEQVLPNRYSKSVFYSNVFTVPKPGTTLHRPVLDLKRVVRYRTYHFSIRTTLETMPQESDLDWRAYSRILQCKSRPPQPSFRDESQIVIQSNQELQLATEERSVQSHQTSDGSNPDGPIRISPEPSNDQLLNNQNECTPPRLESMEAVNLISDDSSTSSSSSSLHVSSRSLSSVTLDP
ncbi:hypothetical protein ACTFIW_003761 [Dictyostelium discoideum]